MMCRLAMCRRFRRTGVNDPKRPGAVPGSARSEIDNCAGRVRVFAPLTKLLASPGGGGGMARRTGARKLARALVSANDIELDQPAGGHVTIALCAKLPKTAGGAHLKLASGRSLGADYTERGRWCCSIMGA